MSVKCFSDPRQGKCVLLEPGNQLIDVEISSYQAHSQLRYGERLILEAR